MLYLKHKLSVNRIITLKEKSPEKGFFLERVGRIELPTQPWEGHILPLNYTRPDALLRQALQILNGDEVREDGENRSAAHTEYGKRESEPATKQFVPMGIYLEPMRGFEPSTFALRKHCSTN